MATLSHEPADALPDRQRWQLRLLVPEMWASLAIAVMWLSVLFDAVLGPDIVSITAGASVTRIPSAVAIAPFAYLATRVVAKYALGRPRKDDPAP